MKNIFFMSTLIVLSMACADNGLNKRDSKIKSLTQAPWFPESVIHETDGDLTSQYETMAFSFTKNNKAEFDGEYFVVNSGVAFPDAVGKWKFSEELDTILLSNGQELEVALTENSLELKVVVPPGSGGRASGLSGRFTFLLKH